MSSFLYSIVIPHYNSSRLLLRMLDSIPQRDDIQVIVVDDGSDINDIREMKKCNHSNLEFVYLSNNSGAGYARNVGLQYAKGKWVLVVDADDIFAENAFDVFDLYKDYDIDYLGFCIKCVDTDTLKPNGRKIVSDESVRLYLKNPTNKTLNFYKFKNTVCWNKMVLLDFIKRNNISFENSVVNNDVFYTFQIGFYSVKFKVIHDELYYFTENYNSITHIKRSLEREFLFFLQVQKRNGFYEKMGLNYYPFYRRTIFYLPHMLLKRGVKDTLSFFEMIRERKNEIDEARKAYLFLFDK
ncbi:MAG: glycosyltransferase family 2 protein [Bacteroidales bacterium]|nr:glycosyltransferase family 2 protein [Bacteroidales bacterium]